MRSFIAFVAVAGLVAAGAGSFGVVRELGRAPTEAEIAAVGVSERALRWRTWPAERIFPAVATEDGVGYATRIAIAPESGCAAALEPEAARLLEGYGCRHALRATYADVSGTLVATVVVLPLRDAKTASDARFAGSWLELGPRPLGFPRTAAARFDDNRRQRFVVEHRDRYLVLGTGGHVDGRPAIANDNDELFGFLGSTVSLVAEPLGDPVPPCQVKEVVAC